MVKRCNMQPPRRRRFRLGCIWWLTAWLSLCAAASSGFQQDLHHLEVAFACQCPGCTAVGTSDLSVGPRFYQLFHNSGVALFSSQLKWGPSVVPLADNIRPLLYEVRNDLL